MHDQTCHLDQANEDILGFTVSDEALEAAAGTDRAPFAGSVYTWFACCDTRYLHCRAA